MFVLEAGLCQATERAKNETIRTSEAAQANSQAGIGRSCRANSAWCEGEELSQVWVHRDLGELYRVLELGLELARDRRRQVEA